MAGKVPGPHKLGLFPFIMITAAIIVSVRNLPMMAEAELYMVFYALIAVLAYLIPSALVSAELTTGWPQEGGVYVWVKEAFGERWGFTATWLQWFQMVIGMVTVLAFIAASLAFVFDPAMADNKLFLLVVILAVYWGATYFNLRGLKTSSRISTVCFTSGVLFPGLLIIVLGIIYVVSGNPLQLNLSFTTANLIPDIGDIKSMVLLAGFIFVFAGIEVSAGHANDVKNVRRNYPLAILFAAVICIVINVIGALSVAVVVPHGEISLVSGVMQAVSSFFSVFHLSWLVPIVAVLVVMGAVGQISTWILGPIRGVSIAARRGNLPPLLQKMNRNGIPRNLLILQASLVSLFGVLFALVPGVNAAFWLLLDLTVLVYLMMYILMFLAAIRLRYTRPDVPRAYKVPGGKGGMWFIGGLGLVTVLFTIVIGFFPPEQLSMGSVTTYHLFLGVGLVVVVAIPLIIYRLRKPGWRVSGEDK